MILRDISGSSIIINELSELLLMILLNKINNCFSPEDKEWGAITLPFFRMPYYKTIIYCKINYFFHGNIPTNYQLEMTRFSLSRSELLIY